MKTQPNSTLIFRASFALVLAFVALNPQAEASTIFATGFESPSYSPGQLVGQDDWFNSASAGIVENTVSNGGSQAAESNASGIVGQSFAVHAASYDIAANGYAPVTYTVDLMLNHLANVNWYAGGFFGDTGLVNQLFVIGSTGEVRLAGFSSGVTMTPGTWYQLEVNLDFLDHATTAYLDGINLGTQTFVHTPTKLTSLIGVGLSNSSGADGSLFYDNMSVTSAVPEPATLALIGLPLIGLGVWPRRRRLH